MGSYDAFLLVSFGGPEGPDDVMPFLENVTRGRGISRERVLALATSAHASYSGCRQYREHLAGSLGAAGLGQLAVDKIRHYFDHPGFIAPFVDWWPWRSCNTAPVLVPSGRS